MCSLVPFVFFYFNVLYNQEHEGFFLYKYEVLTKYFNQNY